MDSGDHELLLIFRFGFGNYLRTYVTLWSNLIEKIEEKGKAKLELFIMVEP